MLHGMLCRYMLIVPCMRSVGGACQKCHHTVCVEPSSLLYAHVKDSREQ